MSKKYTLNQLLDEIRSQTPKFEVGQHFEVLKSIYPDVSIGEEIKNISIDDMKATKPLACSSKAKKEFKKDNTLFWEFFKDNTRGDFLEIVETDGYSAVCVNKSIKEQILEDHYKDESMRRIDIKFNDIINGNVKRVYRGIKKYIGYNKLMEDSYESKDDN